MKYCKMEYVEKEVSKLLYGTAAEPFLSGKDGNELLDMAVSFGINTIDTARNYALAEKSCAGIAGGNQLAHESAAKHLFSCKHA